MQSRVGLVAFAAALLLSPAAATPGHAVDIQPHRALYQMSLMRAGSASGVVGASGSMSFSWSDTCDGWAVEQRYTLHMEYAEQDDTEVTISFATLESKDGTRYRFNVRKQHEGDAAEVLRGEARVHRPGGGEARFTKPDATTLPLPAGSLFPSGHTVRLIEAALAGKTFLSEKVFDGGTVEGAYTVTGGIGKMRPAPSDERNPLLRKRWWPVRLAFFPPDGDSALPDYELGMELGENGVARAMILDYGNFVIRARLEKLEALPRSTC